jgi:hypothetical protein
MATSSTKAKYSKLNNDQSDLRNVAQIMYPTNLFSVGTGHFMLININRLAGSSYQDSNQVIENSSSSVVSGNTKQPLFYSRGYTIQNQISGGGRYIRSKESIILAMPESVSAQYGVEWNVVELGMAAKFAREIATFDQNTLRDVGNSLKEGLKNTIAGAVESLTGFNAKQTAELYTGTIQNPFQEVLYKGVKNRDHTFEFKFTPRNNYESRVVSEIFRRLKFHMHPEFKYRKNDSSYFLYPSTFDITFMKIEEGEAKRNVWLHRVNTCALVGCTDNPSVGGYAVHPDHSSVARSLSLSFQELAPLRKTDFESAEESF